MKDEEEVEEDEEKEEEGKEEEGKEEEERKGRRQIDRDRQSDRQTDTYLIFNAQSWGDGVAQ